MSENPGTLVNPEIVGNWMSIPSNTRETGLDFIIKISWDVLRDNEMFYGIRSDDYSFEVIQPTWIRGSCHEVHQVALIWKHRWLPW